MDKKYSLTILFKNGEKETLKSIFEHVKEKLIKQMRGLYDTHTKNYLIIDYEGEMFEHLTYIVHISEIAMLKIEIEEEPENEE